MERVILKVWAGASFGGCWGGVWGATALPKTQAPPPPSPKAQLAPLVPQAPRSNSSWFSIIPTEIKMCHHFNITFSYIFLLLLRQGRSQGRLASDDKLIFNRSLASLELIFVEISCSCNFKKHIKSIYLYTLAVSPSLGGSRQHKRNNKNNRGFTPFFQQ